MPIGLRPVKQKRNNFGAIIFEGKEVLAMLPDISELKFIGFDFEFRRICGLPVPSEFSFAGRSGGPVTGFVSESGTGLPLLRSSLEELLSDPSNVLIGYGISEDLRLMDLQLPFGFRSRASFLDLKVIFSDRMAVAVACSPDGSFLGRSLSAMCSILGVRRIGRAHEAESDARAALGCFEALAKIYPLESLLEYSDEVSLSEQAAGLDAAQLPSGSAAGAWHLGTELVSMRQDMAGTMSQPLTDDEFADLPSVRFLRQTLWKPDAAFAAHDVQFQPSACLFSMEEYQEEVRSFYPDPLSSPESFEQHSRCRLMLFTLMCRLFSWGGEESVSSAVGRCGIDPGTAAAFCRWRASR
jgi:hypothetical protein